MKRIISALFSLVLLASADAGWADTFGSGANTFNIDFVTIGNPGNPPDMGGVPIQAGSVPYVYQMGKYEISEQMIDDANALGGLGITKDTRGPNKPATSISWFEAAKFVNWLNTSSGYSPAYKFDAVGTFQVWQPSDPGYVPGSMFRNSLAKYVLPSVDEWYKAAYYDPTTGVYNLYPTGSNTVPVAVASGTAAGTAIYRQNIPADVTEAGGLSAYGTIAQGGNAFEWVETASDADFTHSPNTTARSIRGGFYGSIADDLSSLSLLNVSPSSAGDDSGFRVASVVAEPASITLFVSAVFALFSGVSAKLIKRRFQHA
jgi:formylglycine-generating enzyme